MIEKIEMKNFKCFEEFSMNFYPITLLTGLNSSGKSSIIQAIRMCLKKDFLEGHGSFEELVYKNAESQVINFAVQFENDQDIAIELYDSMSFHGSDYDIPENIFYLSAERLGPRVTLPYQEVSPHVGDNGEYTYSFINTFREYSGVPELLRHASIPHISGVFEQIRAWLKLISPYATFDYGVLPKADSSYGSFAECRPTNVGFGLSYTLPIIASVIAYASKVAHSDCTYATLLIENPEAHLHPKGQTQLGRFLALASQCGVQLIVETHSEHIFNGIRLAIKEGLVNCDDAVCHFFSYAEDLGYSSSEAIYIDKDGMVDPWPEDFCDEAEKTLLRML